MKPKPAKRTSARVAKMAGRYLDMTDEQLWCQINPHESLSVLGYEEKFSLKRFCKRFRAICASALSQTETEPAKKKVKP